MFIHILVGCTFPIVFPFGPPDEKKCSKGGGPKQKKMVSEIVFNILEDIKVAPAKCFSILVFIAKFSLFYMPSEISEKCCQSWIQINGTPCICLHFKQL